MNLYIDVLFAVNVWMNVGLLALTGVWLKYRRRTIFLFLGAAAGGVFSCILAVFPVLPKWGELLLAYFLAGPLMCRIAFGGKGVKALLREMVSFLAVSVFAGGLLSQIYFHTGAGYVMRELWTGRSAKGGGLPVLLLLAAASFFAGKEVLFFLERAGKSREILVRIALKNGDRRIVATALLDTGNRLYDPATKRPVSIVEQKVFRTLFPEEEEEAKGFFLIPYRSLGGKGFLKGQCFSEMSLIGEDGSETPIPGEPFLAALSEGGLSGDGSFQMILHGDFAAYLTSFRTRRKRHGHQSSSSQQVSVENHFQHERASVFKEERGPLHRRERRASGAPLTGNGGGDDREAGNGRGEGGEGGSY